LVSRNAAWQLEGAALNDLGAGIARLSCRISLRPRECSAEFNPKRVVGASGSKKNSRR
jgi:hypothetical protein